MAKMPNDLPGYQRTTTITPAAAPVGFEQSVEGVVNSMQTFGAMNAQIASDASKARSQMAGKEMGATPGIKMLPPITDADKVYKEAYVSESSKILASQADKLINQAAFTFGKNPMPSGRDLEKYEENIVPGLQDLLAKADPSIKSDLERAIFDKYSSEHFRLAGRVEDANVKRTLANFNSSTQQNMINIYNYNSQGLVDFANNAYVDQVKNLQSVRYLIGEDKYQQGIINAKQALDSSLYESRMMEVYDNEGELGAIQFVQDFAKHEQPGLSDVERDSLLPGMLARFAQESKIRTLNDSIVKSDAYVEMAASDTGTLTADRLQFYQDNLSHEAFNDVQIKQLNAQAKGLETASVLSFMNANANNSIALKQLEPAQLEAGFKEAIKIETEKKGSPLTLEEEGNLLRAYDIPSSMFSKKMSGGINSRNPEIADYTARVYNSLAKNSPNAVSGLSDTDAQKAQFIYDQVHSGALAKDAVDYANDKVGPKNATQIKESEELFKKMLSDKSWNSTTVQSRKIMEALDFGNLKAPSGLTTDFMNAFKRNFVIANDWDKAMERATLQTSQRYKKTNINGPEEVMYLAPDNNITTRNLTINQAESIFKAQRHAFEYEPDSGVDFYFDFEEGAVRDVEDIRRQSRLNASKPEFIPMAGTFKAAPFNAAAPTRIKRVEANGRETKGVLYIGSDNYTDTPPVGENISYGMWFIPDGGIQPKPIFNPSDYTLARFSVPSDFLQDLRANKEEQQLKNEEALAKMQSRNKIAKMILSEESPLSISSAIWRKVFKE